MDFFFFWISGLIGFSCVSDFQDILYWYRLEIGYLCKMEDWHGVEADPTDGNHHHEDARKVEERRFRSIIPPLIFVWAMWFLFQLSSCESCEALKVVISCELNPGVHISLSSCCPCSTGSLCWEGQHRIAREVKQSICVMHKHKDIAINFIAVFALVGS